MPFGGAQALVADLAGGLAARGHEVLLLAARGSRVAGARAVDLGIDPRLLEPAALDRAAPRADDAAQREAFTRIRAWLAPRDIDVVHAHAYDASAFETLQGLRAVVHTLHLAPRDPIVVGAAREAAASGATLASVSRSNADAWTAAGARVSEVLPNGVDVSAIPFGAARGGPLVFAARMSPEKGPEIAIRAARAAGRDVVLAGGIYDSAHFTGRVEPLLGPAARYLGALARREVQELMSRASALLAPVQWDEPFGLAAVEAQAAGAPVVAFARGGLREIVVDGRTGWLVTPDDESAFTSAIGRVDEIDRAACRANAQRFTLDRMLDAHEALYQRLGIAGKGVSSRS